MLRRLSARMVSAYLLLVAASFSYTFGQQIPGDGVGGASGLLGQNAQADQAPHTVRGTVINSVTGEPIYRALVQVGGQYAALTDHEGRFEFEGLTFTAFVPFVMKPGYFEGASSVQSSDQPLVLKLVPEAVISGTVIGQDGAPLEGIPVHLKTLAVQDGLPRWRQRQETRTNSEGQYRFAELEAGKYVVATGFHAEGLAEAESRLGYVPTRYPSPGGGSSSPESAIVLNAGDRTVVDLSPEVQKLFPVTGVITGYGESRGVGFRVETANGEQITPLSRFAPRTGEFRLMLPTGSFLVTATAYARQGPMEGRREVTVSQGPVSGVTFTMEPYASIPVEVEQQAVSQPSEGTAALGGVPPLTDSSANLSLTSTNEDGLTPFLSAQPIRHPGGAAPGQEGPLTIENVSPGRYVLRAQPPSPWYVASASCGSVDLTREELTVGGGSVGCSIRVVLRNDSGSARVTLRDSALAGQPGTYVYALPLGNLAQQVVMLNRQNAAFSADGMAPGRYLVLALDHAEELAYRDPESLRRYAGLGQEITVTPNGKADAEVALAAKEP